jgi:hypothetical protein
MVLEDPATAVGAAAVVFFVVLGSLYLFDVKFPGKTWLGILFLLIGTIIALFLFRQAGVGGLAVAVVAAMLAKSQLERRGIVK